MVRDPQDQGKKFLNRELQWLEFNRRVLQLAQDPTTPLLERVRFMSIFTANLDEFTMKRMGGLQRQIHFGLAWHSLDGLTAQEQLVRIREKILPMVVELSKLFKDEIRPSLAKHNIHLKKWKQLTADQQQEMRAYYQKNIFPVLTPLVVDNALPFPFISNLSLSLALKLKVVDSQEWLFGRVKIPEIFPQWLAVNSPEGGYVYVSLLQVIAFNLHDLFPDMEVLQIMPFRITRNADLESDYEGAEDLLEMITEELKQRRFAEPVRLEVGKNSDPWMVNLLKEELELTDNDIYEVPGLIDYKSLMPIADLPFPHLQYSPWTPLVPAVLADQKASIFDIIRRKDVLVHHPYESFTVSAERFVRAAAEDPNVLAIKMTLYRTNEKSSIITHLIKAAEQGKQVVCLVELKARFDEERNIFWAQQMEKAGIHVVYGVIGFKTHCKTTLVLRQEGQEISAYCHIGTGNYNSATAKAYTDLGLFTADPAITGDVVQLFHFLTGRSFKRKFNELLVAPMNMKNGFLELIEREIDHRKKGRPAHIVAKFNSLEDREICLLLYKASKEGVKVDLIVRGFCCLRPQEPGLSENINVYSILGRFLEHSRIFFFQNGAGRPVEGDFYIGSADWMRRNLHGRVEVVTPLRERSLKRKVWEVLQVCIDDYKQCWQMKADGSYVRRVPQGNQSLVGSQERLMQIIELQNHLPMIDEDIS